MARPLSVRGSLATRVVAISALVLAAPLAYLAVSSLVERFLASRTETRMAECLEALHTSTASDRERVAASTCAPHHLRVRWIPRDGAPVDVGDSLLSSALDDRIGDLFYGPERLDALVAYDATHPLRLRPEIGGGSHCDALPDANLRVCGRALREADGVLHVMGSSRTAHDDRYALRRQLAAMMALGAVLAVLLLAWLRRLVTQPLAALASDIEAASAPRGTGRLDEARASELAAVARAFNALAGDLERESAQHRAFLADLAHEMKGPVATVRAAAEALDGPAGESASARRALIERAEQSAMRLEKLVLQFLELSRAEATPTERSTIDLGALVRGIASSTTPPEGITLDVDVEGACTVLGDAGAIESAISNLIDNAFVFATARVRVHASAGVDVVEITVEDDGPGIAPADRERIFDRFQTQRPATRARGTGLGLAIVRAVALAHGGSVTARDSTLGGAALVVRLPPAR